MAKKKGILERLKDGPVLGDGGYLLELEKRGWVRAGPFTPEVALLHPDALRELHVEFREAGADVLERIVDLRFVVQQFVHEHFAVVTLRLGRHHFALREASGANG